MSQESEKKRKRKMKEIPLSYKPVRNVLVISANAQGLQKRAIKNKVPIKIGDTIYLVPIPEKIIRAKKPKKVVELEIKEVVTEDIFDVRVKNDVLTVFALDPIELMFAQLAESSKLEQQAQQQVQQSQQSEQQQVQQQQSQK